MWLLKLHHLHHLNFKPTTISRKTVAGTQNSGFLALRFVIPLWLGYENEPPKGSCIGGLGLKTSVFRDGALCLDHKVSDLINE